MEKTRKQRAAQDRQIKLYRIFLVVFIALLLLFCTSKLWLPEDTKITNTMFGTKHSTSDAISLVLNDWQYNPTSNYMEAAFDVQQKNYIYSNSLRFTAELYSDNSQRTPLDCKVAYSDEDTLILQIRDLPPGWEILSLRIGDNSLELKTAATGDLNASSSSNPFAAQADKTPAHFNCDVRAVKMNTSLSPKAELDYAVDSISNHIGQQNGQITAYRAQVAANLDTISMLENDIEGIKKEQPYQMDSELDDSNAMLQDKEKQIANLREKNQTYEESIADCKQKIQKLNLKLKDLKSRNTRVHEDSYASSAANSALESGTSSSPSTSAQVPGHTPSSPSSVGA